MGGANHLPRNGISSEFQGSTHYESHPCMQSPRLLRSRGCGPARTDDRDGGRGARGQPPPDLPRDATDRKDGRRTLHLEGEQMSVYRTKNGARLTDEDIEHLAEAAERGDYPGVPGAFVVAPPGRPRISEEELVTIAFKVPRSRREALDREAKACGRTRSQLIREVLERALARTADESPAHRSTATASTDFEPETGPISTRK